jgi:hypothetical protein
MPDGALHAAQTGANLHIAIRYIAASDPYVAGVTKAYDIWADTAGGSGAWILKVRNAGNSDWEQVGNATVSPETVDESDVTISNASAVTTFDADDTTLNEVADYVAQVDTKLDAVIAALQTLGLFEATP